MPRKETLTVRMEESLKTKLTELSRELGTTPAVLARDILDDALGHSKAVLIALSAESRKMEDSLRKAMDLLGSQIAHYQAAKGSYLNYRAMAEAADFLRGEGITDLSVKVAVDTLKSKHNGAFSTRGMSSSAEESKG